MAAKRVEMQTEKKLLSTAGIAMATGYTQDTIRFKVRTGAIPAVKFGRTLRFDPEAVLRALQETK